MCIVSFRDVGFYKVETIKICKKQPITFKPLSQQINMLVFVIAYSVYMSDSTLIKTGSFIISQNGVKIGQTKAEITHYTANNGLRVWEGLIEDSDTIDVNLLFNKQDSQPYHIEVTTNGKTYSGDFWIKRIHNYSKVGAGSIRTCEIQGNGPLHGIDD